MNYIIYNSKTKEVACIYDDTTDNFDTFGNYTIKPFDDEVVPILDVYDDGTVEIVENVVMMFPEYFDDNYDEEK